MVNSTQRQCSSLSESHPPNAKGSSVKSSIKITAQWLLLMCFGPLVHASDTHHEFRECPLQHAASTPQSCESQCLAFGSSPTSYAVDLAAGKVNEKTWQGATLLNQRPLTGCNIKDAQNWRCLSESVVMGGIVRRDTYAIDGQVFMDVGGSGGDQHYCSLKQSKSH
jgi:hypothetical protein